MARTRKVYIARLRAQQGRPEEKCPEVGENVKKCMAVSNNVEKMGIYGV